MSTSTPSQQAPEASEMQARPLAQDLGGRYRLGFASGRGIVRARWLIIALWTVALLAALPFAAHLPGILTGGGYSPENSDSIRVQNLVIDRLHRPVAQAAVVFHAETTLVSDPAFQQEMQTFVDKARSFWHVSGIEPAVTGQDGRTALITVDFDQSSDAVEQHLDALHQLLPSGAAARPARAYLTGDVAVYSAITSLAQTDAERADSAALPIALIVLLFVFGTVVAAVMPLALALVAIPIALGIIDLVARQATTNVTVLSIASIIGLGLAIDYSLLLTRRFREELASGRAPAEAVAWTLATAGEAILFSGLAVLIGFIGMLFLGIQVMTSLGLGGGAVVLIAVLAALTLLPALLSLLGHRVNALPLRLSRRTMDTKATKTHESHEAKNKFRGPSWNFVPFVSRNPAASKGGFWHRWAVGVMRRPVLILVIVAALLVGMGWPLLALKVGLPSYTTLPKNLEVRQGIDILHAQYPGSDLLPVYIIAQTTDGTNILTTENLAKVDQLSGWLAARDHLSAITSLTRFPATSGAPAPTLAQLTALYTSGAYQQNPGLQQAVANTTNGDTTLILATSDTPLDSDAGKQLITRLRAEIGAQANGMHIQIGGLQAVSLDFNNDLYGNFPRAVIFILVATFIILLLLFRSILLPLKAVLVNVLSISAAYGVLVWIFQFGNFQGLLGYTGEGFIESTVPILFFCILFGLSMDYEVFLLSRIHEEWLRTHNNREAVAQGLEKTGGTITSAALIFTIVTAAITTTVLLATKETGLGMTAAILVDATIIRTLLVPATMRLLGKWNWWFPGQPMPVEQKIQA